MRTLPWLMVLAACSGLGGAADDWQPVSYVDSGEVCFTAGQDGDVVVTVTVDGCLSSSCSRAFGGSCTATVSGTTITLTSDIHWEQNVGVGATCTDDCGTPTVSCTIAGLADGTYDIVHGPQTVPLVVPVVDTCPEGY